MRLFGLGLQRDPAGNTPAASQIGIDSAMPMLNRPEERRVRLAEEFADEAEGAIAEEEERRQIRPGRHAARNTRSAICRMTNSTMPSSAAS